MSFIRVGPSNLVLTAVKKSEDGAGLLLRFYEWAGKSGTATVTVPGGFSNATLTNLMETPEAGSLAVSSGTISVPFSPFSIVTLRVEYPKQAPALLSRSDGR
jgi:alpha-mannosidase